MKRLFCIFLMLLFLPITHAEKKISAEQIEFEVKANSRTVFFKNKVMFIINIQNNSPFEIRHATIRYLHPREYLEYISSDPKDIYRKFDKKKFITFVNWKITIPTKSKKTIKVITRTVKGITHLINVFQFSYLGIKKEVNANIRIIGSGGFAHLSTYDTDDPCVVGTKITYVVTARNEGTSAITNIVIKNICPKEMKFLKVKSGPRHRYNKREHYVEFMQTILEAGETIKYKIECEAITKGKARNIACLKYDQFGGEIIDQEETIIHK